MKRVSLELGSDFSKYGKIKWGDFLVTWWGPRDRAPTSLLVSPVEMVFGSRAKGTPNNALGTGANSQKGSPPLVWAMLQLAHDLAWRVTGGMNGQPWSFSGEAKALVFWPSTFFPTIFLWLFLADPERIAFIPEALCDQLFQENPGLKELMESKILPRVKGTLMFSRSWAVDIGLPKNQDILCDALLIAPRSRVLLLTIAKPPAANVKSHSRRTAKQLKHKLVNIGGFSQKICVISRILRLNGDASPVGLQVPTHAACPYPKTYRLHSADLCALQNSVVIVLLGFTSSLSDFLGVHFLNLLTIKQYENISKNLRKTPHQFIYGLPGSGKTVVALEILGKIRNEFNCDPNEILYICENRPLRDFVRWVTWRPFVCLL